MKVDLLIKNANVFNVFLKKWKKADLYILKGKIFFVDNSMQLNLSSECIFDAKDKYIIPSFIDIHMHIESSLCTPRVFSNEAIKHGITTVVAEPHEIANVFGKIGITSMIEQSENQIVDIFYGLPSSVPSTSYELENNGGEIDCKAIEELLNDYDSVICLGEVMQYRNFINNFEKYVIENKKSKTLKLIEAVKKNNPLLAIEGHCPSIVDLDLARVLYLGVNSDHCQQSPSSMMNRFEQGMFVQLQDKSITKANIDVIKDGTFSGLYSFVTDDCPPNIFVEKGHLDHIFRKAISLGLPFEEAIVASSYSPAKRMGFRDRGAIAPGYIADFLIVDRLDENFKILNVFKDGKNISENSNAEEVLQTNEKGFPNFFYNSIRLHKDFDIIKALNLIIKDKDKVKAKVMRKNSLSTYTQKAYREFSVVNNEVDWENDNCNLVLSINRYGKNSCGYGFLDGSAIEGGALCSSHAHDSHNLLLLGDNKDDMIIAYNRIVEIQGGIVLVIGGKIVSEIPLSVGGVISEIEMTKLSSLVIDMQNKLYDNGVIHANPLMSLLTITLPVSPQLKLSDKGLIDVTKQKIVSLFE